MAGLLLASGAALAGGLRGPGAPSRSTADITPGTACGATSGDGTSNAVTCDLWATTGTLALPGTSVAIWGFAPDDVAAGVPGPTIVVDEGDAVSVNLHNRIPGETISLSIRGQGMEPDTTGVASGGDKPYAAFTASLPGTYVYEAGLTENGDRQVGMGLYGAFIVLPLPGTCTDCAYDGIGFDDENLIVLSEVDPDLNADPTAYDMHDWAPTYWLINGQAYDRTVVPEPNLMTAGAGDSILLRYVNAGLTDHAMGLLGASQAVVATDGFPLSHPYTVVSEIIPAGSTMDMLAAIPADAPDMSRIAVENTAGHLDNAGSAAGGAMIALGGQLAFIQVSGEGGPAGGPITTNVLVDPNPSSGGNVDLSATISPDGGPAVSAAEFFVDALGASGSGTPMSLSAPDADGIVTATATFDTTALDPGPHTFFVHGSNGTVWGPVDSTELNLDTAGPDVFGVSFNPNPTMGDGNIAITGTASDADNGGAPVADARYQIDGGAFVGMNLTNPGAVTTEITGVIDGTALSEGAHTVGIQAMDCLGLGCADGSWGAATEVTLRVDQTGPDTTAVTIFPNPNSGSLSFDVNKFAVKLTATVTDPVVAGVNTRIAEAEGFIDAPGDDGTGFAFIPTDGSFNQSTEAVYVEIPLSGIQALTEGDHTVFVHGRDRAGNWGDYGTTTLTIDKSGPTISGLTVDPNPTAGAFVAQINATATDDLVNVVEAEWFDGADPGAGNGFPMIGLGGGFGHNPQQIRGYAFSFFLGNGEHNLGVRARDASGNWGPVERIVLTVAPADLIFADGFGVAGLAPWSTSAGNVNVVESGEPKGMSRLRIRIDAGVGGSVVDRFGHAVRQSHVRFDFNAHGTRTSNRGHPILVATDNQGRWVYKVLYRRVGTSAEIRLVARKAGGVARTSWTSIARSKQVSIEVAWKSRSNATLRLEVNGNLRAKLTRLNTSALRVREIRMGALGSLGSVTGAELFDDFVSTRKTRIGP